MFVPASVGYCAFENMPCSAWPNSWNIVVTSSKLSSAGWPAAGLVKFATLKTTGFVPSRPVLVDEVVHPRAAALVVALEVVGVEERERLAVGVEHLEHADVGMVDRECPSAP